MFLSFWAFFFNLSMGIMRLVRTTVCYVSGSQELDKKFIKSIDIKLTNRPVPHSNMTPSHFLIIFLLQWRESHVWLDKWWHTQIRCRLYQFDCCDVATHIHGAYQEPPAYQWEIKLPAESHQYYEIYALDTSRPSIQAPPCFFIIIMYCLISEIQSFWGDHLFLLAASSHIQVVSTEH